MDISEQLKTAMKELQKLTNLPLELSISEESDAEELLIRLQALSSAYKDANNKEVILRRFLTNDISEEEFYSFAERMNFDREEKRGIFLIELKHEITDDVITVLKNMIHDASSWIIPFHNNQLIIILRFSKRREYSISEKAYEILDTLNTELMEEVKISHSRFTDLIDQLPDAYQKAYLALQIGHIFYPDRTIYDYDKMEVGYLLYGLSEDICKEYIRIHLGSQYLTEESSIFQTDILQTANCFLKNNLNIAETARQLHIHRNTLLYRLEQIQNESGLDIRKFEHAMTYKLRSMILLYLKFH